MKKLLLTIITGCTLTSVSLAQLNILPGIDETSGSGVAQSVDNVLLSGGGNTIDAYYREASRLDKAAASGSGTAVGRQIASGVMSWNTIMGYAAYLVKFISQLGLFVGALMIIRAGYEYATFVFTGSAGSASKRIRNAITGVIIIIFSYAIMRIVTTAFLS